MIYKRSRFFLMKKFFIFLTVVSVQVNAQQIDSLKKKPVFERHFFNPDKHQSYILPTALITYGLISLGDNPIRDLDISTFLELTEDNSRFASKLDDYIEFAPLVAMYGLDIAGVKSKNSVLDQTNMALLTTLITTGMVHTLKSNTDRMHPDGSTHNSFPSGHTATAFAAAELLGQEFKHQSMWYGYAGYFVASATGILRMYNNRHWLSDVVAGAGFGMLSTKLTYLVYPHLKRFLVNKQQDMAMAPFYQSGVVGMSFKYKPRK